MLEPKRVILLCLRHDNSCLSCIQEGDVPQVAFQQKSSAADEPNRVHLEVGQLIEARCALPGVPGAIAPAYQVQGLVLLLPNIIEIIWLEEQNNCPYLFRFRWK